MSVLSRATVHGPAVPLVPSDPLTPARVPALPKVGSGCEVGKELRAAHKAAQDATDAITALDAKQQDERKLVTDAEAELHALASADLTDRLDAKRKLDELAAVVSRHVHEQQMRPVVDAQHRAVRALQEFCREHEDEIRAALSPELEAADAEHVKYLASGEKIRQRLQDAHGQFGTLASLVGA